MPVQTPAVHEVAVKVSYIVDKRGRPSHCKVVESSGHEALDRKTCSMIERRLHFEPKVENGKRVLSRKTQTVLYRIEE